MLSLHPTIFPVNFKLLQSAVYIPPSANSKAGAKLVTQDTNGALARYNGGPRGF